LDGGEPVDPAALAPRAGTAFDELLEDMRASRGARSRDGDAAVGAATWCQTSERRIARFGEPRRVLGWTA
jgi:hypothetical protein